MANVNKVILVGRLTRDPETRTFSNGGKVAKFGFAVSNRKKNAQTGQWEDVPMFIDCEAYNRGEFGKQADLVEQYLAKGRQVYLEGRLELDQWDDKTTGAKRSKHKLVVENMQFLDSGQREDGAEGGGSRPARTGAPAGRPAAKPAAYVGEDDTGGEPDAGGNDAEIPF
ncbi:MAG TPA: single-stranded DNA-binding protein [Gemmataceae bacterium]|jgi:single-strand DNA-binding protein